MEVYNNSNFKHLLFRAALLDDNFAASIALRVNYSIEEGMATAITMDPFWKLEANPQETIYGSLINEAVIKRGGIDLFLFGYAALSYSLYDIGKNSFCSHASYPSFLELKYFSLLNICT